MLVEASADVRRVPRGMQPRGARAARRPLRGHRDGLAHASGHGKLHWAAVALVVALAVPWIIPIGPLNLSTDRIVLLVMVVPCLVGWASGKSGPIRLADIAVLLMCLWTATSLVAAHGPAAATQPAGIFFVETAGAYFLARYAIRNADTYRDMIGVAAKVVLLLMPFAFYEMVSGTKPLLTAFGLVFPTVDPTTMPRSGLWRAQGPFNHSILFGAYCASIFALVFTTADHGRVGLKSLLLSVAVAFTAGLALSSAPLAAIVIQAALIAWNLVLGSVAFRWKILWLAAFLGYLTVQFGSNQSPAQFYISKFTFDQQTGWYRLWIWEHGSASVLAHPLLGIGFNDWVRPAWMPSDTVDNFWLLTAMRYGIPALLFLILALLLVTLSVARRRFSDPRLDSYRTGYLICMVALVFVGSTVHFTGPSYVWFMFLLGSATWFLDTADGVGEAETPNARHVTPNRNRRAEMRGNISAPRRPRRADGETSGVRGS